MNPDTTVVNAVSGSDYEHQMIEDLRSKREREKREMDDANFFEAKVKCTY